MESKQLKLMKHLHWLGHDTFRLDQPLVIYIDPWRLPVANPPADLILISHEHFDHCSPEAIEKIRTAGTVILANMGAAKSLGEGVTVMKPGEQHVVGSITIEAVPAYNVDKPFHPQEANHLGFILEIDGERLYFAGDTDVIPEMKSIRCDIALLPVSGIYTMDADQAAQAAGILHPKIAMPMHYGAGEIGTSADAERFQEKSPVPVAIPGVEGQPQKEKNYGKNAIP
jgi:L-ascorbate metabolism protein UlaG (beta-lactamase superfamily)